MRPLGTSEVRIAGFGGQGVILAGMIIGKAHTIFAGQHSTMMQSFGPEARGGSCSAQVILSDERINYPYVRNPDVLVALSQEALGTYLPSLKPGGKLIFEESLVNVSAVSPDVERYGAPAIQIAESLRRRIVLNIVVVGFFAAVVGVLDREAARRAVLDTVPKGTEGLNGRAFDQGYEQGAKLVGDQ
jgi:2-oxoglutarate ferredoxin oxidoreductase subunit gamma